PTLNVTVSDECLNIFQSLKLHKMYKYILYKFSEDKKYFVIDKAVETTESDEDDGTSYKESYEKFYAEITGKNVPYFAIYDFDYEKLGEGLRNKIIFISWIPTNADIQDKVLSAASKQVLGTKLDVSFQIEGTEANDIKFEAAFTSMWVLAILIHEKKTSSEVL
ncbi:16759_t:CDS:2, partial [Dentiscutata erythropus]